jgi:hypothetical protein
MRKRNAYSAFGVDIVHCADTLGGLDDGGGLDGDLVSEAFAFTVDDAWNEDVTSHAKAFGGFDDDVVRVRSLVDRQC